MKRVPTLMLAGLALLVIGAAVLAQETRPIYLIVRVPANAAVEVEGIKTQQSGEVRYLMSPPVAVGKSYHYRIRATWMDKGMEVNRVKEIRVRAGDEIEVDLRQEATAKIDQTPKKDDKPKVDTKVVQTPKKADRPKTDTVKKEDKRPTQTAKIDEKPKQPVVKPKDVKPEVVAKPKLLVPYVPTPQEVVDKMLEMAKVTKNDVVYDLGCGDGRILVTAAKKYGARGVGVDIDPERVKDSVANAKKENVENLIDIRQGDVLTTDVSDATVVTLYLLPEVNLKLRPILQGKLKPGSRIVSHDFDMGDWKPAQRFDMVDPDGIDHTIYLWEIPKK